MRDLIEALFPLCRSISGPGLRQSLDIIDRALPTPTQRTEVPTGTQVFDWTINDEWTPTAAWIADPDGHRLVDFADHNLHLVGYSTPFDGRVTRAELEPHLHHLPDQPDLIPYRTSYYHRDWGFCLTQHQYDALGAGPFDVHVDTTLAAGSLTYGELVIPGSSTDEILISSHVCHPSLVNDNLSGIAVAVAVAKVVAQQANHHSIRFLFAPGTIGSLAWLSRNAETLARVRHGLVLTGVGGPGGLVYKRTRHGGRPIDRAAAHVVSHRGGSLLDYSPWGYDERQFNALGFGLPVGRLSRTPHGQYPEYHTSADDLDFVTDAHLEEAMATVVEVIEVLERDAVLTNQSPYGEPNLGKRGLYPTTGGKAASDAVLAMLWLLAYCDGEHSLLDVSELAGLRFSSVLIAADELRAAGLLR